MVKEERTTTTATDAHIAAREAAKCVHNRLIIERSVAPAADAVYGV